MAGCGWLVVGWTLCELFYPLLDRGNLIRDTLDCALSRDKARGRVLELVVLQMVTSEHNFVNGSVKARLQLFEDFVRQNLHSVGGLLVVGCWLLVALVPTRHPTTRCFGLK